MLDKKIFVYYDGEQVSKPILMGVLVCTNLRGKEVFSFEFNDEWLSNKHFRSFDPDLSLYRGRQYVPQGKDNFGIFLDSTPDRWGRVLLDRREAEMARSENRPHRYLQESDYLLGVYDGCRIGALRFKTDINGEFLDNCSSMSIPPWTSLADLEEASINFENSFGCDQNRWLRMLVAPGSSLGGARPKANVLDKQGHLWIAKFPSNKDKSDVGAWEAVCMELAKKAGLTVSEYKRI